MLATTMQRRGTMSVVPITLLVLLGKLILTSQNEMAATPNDAWSYVAMGGSSAPWNVIGPSAGYPIWLWLGTQSGLPQRVAIELLLIACSTLLASGIGWRLGGLLGYTVILLLAVFSPASFFLFDEALSDGMFACLNLAAVGLASHLLLTSRPSRWLGMLSFGFVLGCLEVTRKETPLLFVSYGLLFCGLVYSSRTTMRPTTWARAIAGSSREVAVAGGATVVVVLALSFAHYEADGLWTGSTADMASHTAMLKRLASIETDRPAIRFVPISHEARRLAYEASPTLARFRSAVEAPDNPYLVESQRVLGMPGEIGAGWIWHLFNAAGPVVGYRSAHDLDVAYGHVNDELDAAFAGGKLRHEFVLHPLFGSNPAVWLPYVPSGIQHVVVNMRSAIPRTPDPGFDVDLFDRVLLRRFALLPNRSDAIRGWAYAKHGTMTEIDVASLRQADSGWATAVAASRTERPDVQAAYVKEGDLLPIDNGFTALVPISTSNDYRLRFTVAGRRFVTDHELVPGKVATIEAGDGNQIVFAVDRLPESSFSLPRWRVDLMNQAIAWYRNGWLWSAMATIVTVTFATLLLRARSSQSAGAIAVIVLLVGWLAARLAFYALIDAAAWGAEPRYVQLSGMLAVIATGASLLAFARFALPTLVRSQPGP